MTRGGRGNKKAGRGRGGGSNNGGGGGGRGRGRGTKARGRGHGRGGGGPPQQPFGSSSSPDHQNQAPGTPRGTSRGGGGAGGRGRVIGSPLSARGGPPNQGPSQRTNSNFPPSPFSFLTRPLFRPVVFVPSRFSKVLFAEEDEEAEDKEELEEEEGVAEQGLDRQAEPGTNSRIKASTAITAPPPLLVSEVPAPAGIRITSVDGIEQGGGDERRGGIRVKRAKEVANARGRSVSGGYGGGDLGKRGGGGGGGGKSGGGGEKKRVLKHREGEEIGGKAPKIDAANVGFRMLAMMGWEDGESIGGGGEGLADPLGAIAKNSKLGLGAETRTRRG